MYRYQIRKDLTHEFGEIISDHIRMSSDGISFKKDKNGDTLRLHLFNDGVSAQFIGTSGAIIRNYGVFESQVSKEEDIVNLNEIKKNATTKKIVVDNDIGWNDIKYSALVTPLEYNGHTIGIMVIAKSLEGLTLLTNTTLLILSILGGLGLLGSFFLGRIFTQNALRPLYKIMWAIEATDLNRLRKKVYLDGHPEDEFVLLGKTFNTMLERLNGMSKHQKEFIANASHELKTPLTRAISSIDVLLLKKNIAPDDLRDLKENIFEINELIDTLLVLGKIHESELPKGNVDLKEVIHSSFQQNEKNIHAKQMQFTIEIPHSFILPLPPEYAKVILGNLISNAIKFSPNGSSIEIIGDPSKKSVSVVDHGIGFSEEEKTKIFDRFYRSKEIRSSTKGYGLGLSLVKEICKEYGIKILVQSVKGNGTSITLSF
jgi:signal transduction histidine kinase